MTSPECHNPRVLKDLNLSLQRGERLLISGPSDVGKSLAYYKTIAGPWTKGSGHLAPIPTRQPYFFFTVSVGDLVASRPITLFESFSSAAWSK